jgi:integrase
MKESKKEVLVIQELSEEEKQEIKDKKLYNPKMKKWFMQNYEEKTQKTIRYVFEKTAKDEKALDKDLYAFNDIDIDRLLYGMEASGKTSIEVQKSIIVNYINFCISEGYVPSGINYATHIKNIDKYISVAVGEHKYISIAQLNEIESICENPQDEIIFELLFFGAKGEANSELFNLKISDVDSENHILNLTNNIYETKHDVEGNPYKIIIGI